MATRAGQHRRCSCHCTPPLGVTWWRIGHKAINALWNRTVGDLGERSLHCCKNRRENATGVPKDVCDDGVVDGGNEDAHEGRDQGNETSGTSRAPQRAHCEYGEGIEIDGDLMPLACANPLQVRTRNGKTAHEKQETTWTTRQGMTNMLRRQDTVQTVNEQLCTWR